MCTAVSDVEGVGGVQQYNRYKWPNAADGEIIVLLHISSDKLTPSSDGKSAAKQLKL